MRSILIILTMVFAGSLAAQDTTFRSKGYVWDDQNPTLTPIEKQFADEPLVSTLDKNKIIIYGTRGPLMFVLVKRHQRFRIMDEEGLAKFKSVRLPESVDPLYDYHDIPLDKRDDVHRPRYYNLKVEYFAARVIKADGRVENIDYRTLVGEEKQLFDEVYHRSWDYEFQFSGLEVGDEIEIDYAWEMPYYVNWYRLNAWRYFFNDDYPKQDFQLTVTHPFRLFNRFAGTAPDSTWTNDKVTYRKWHRQNLEGCLSEVGARPDQDLEHSIFYLNTDNLDYNFVDPITGVVQNGPYWASLIKWRENRGPWLKRIALKRRFFDRQNIKIENFLRTTTLGMQSQNPYARLIKVHEVVNEEFDWQADHAYFAGLDRRLERMGDFTEQGVIREISRYNVYVKYISRLGLNYSTAYLMDKRVGTISSDYLSPIWSNDFTFVFPAPQGSMFMYPKRSRFGLEVNEFPFYLEGSRGLMTNVNRLWSSDPGSPVLINLPVSDEEANVRNTALDVSVNTETGVADYRVRLNLSGQFSTLQRGEYLYDYRDSTLPDEYFQRIYHRGGRVGVSQQELTFRSTDYPYLATFRVDYTHQSFKKVAEDTTLLSLHGLFNPILPEVDAESPRHLPYYPDFRFQDAFTAVFHFDQPIELVYQLGSSVSNGCGDVEWEVIQSGDDEITVHLDWSVTESKIEPEDFKEFVQLIESIREMESNDVLLVRKK